MEENDPMVEMKGISKPASNDAATMQNRVEQAQESCRNASADTRTDTKAITLDQARAEVKNLRDLLWSGYPTEDDNIRGSGVDDALNILARVRWQPIETAPGDGRIYTPDPKGLYQKYVVTNASTGEAVGDCFVLRWPDPHAHVALRAYADSVRSENSLLANDLDALVMRLRVLPTPPEADRGWQDQEQEADGVEWKFVVESCMIGKFSITVGARSKGFEWCVWVDPSTLVAIGTAPTREEARRQAVEAARGMM